MAKDSSEEKTLPPSRKKLRDAREKGQVPKSKDLTSGVALAGGLAYLMLGSGSILAAAVAMIDKAGDVAAGDFQLGLAAMIPVIGHAALGAVLPLLLIAPALVIASAMVVLQGIPFSVTPVVPKADAINPAEGFKRLFAMRSLVELVKSLAKVVVLACVLVAILAGGLDSLVLAPSCGMGCVEHVFHHLAVPLLAAAALAFLLVGVADVGLQRWLFMRDQRMGVSERKRERKDMEGDPHLRGERRRIMREALRLAGGLGMRRATIVIYGAGMTVGLRYKIRDMPAPVPVCRGREDRGRALLADAARLGIAATEDAELAELLYKLPLGHGVPPSFYRMIALALTRVGAI